MPFSKKILTAQIPLILTMVVVIGAAWSWVSEVNQGPSLQEVQARLANFAREGAGTCDEGGKIPDCCAASPSSETSAKAEGQTASCSGCPGSGTSVAGGEESRSSCCSSDSKDRACSASSRCPRSACPKTTLAGTDETQGDEVQALLDAVQIPAEEP